MFLLSVKSTSRHRCLAFETRKLTRIKSSYLLDFCSQFKRSYFIYVSPEAHSCRHLQILGKKLNQAFADDVYEINPDGKGVVKTICDMTRDGGGWTLLVASYTNKWTKQNILRNNEMDPKLKNDYSILFKADDIKNSGNVKGSSFEYRLEADSLGKSTIR